MDEDLERALAALRLLQGLHEDHVISEAQATVDAMPAATDVPMPNTSHPALADKAAWVLSYDGHNIALPKPQRPAWATKDGTEIAPTATLPTMMLTRRKCAAIAPTTTLERSHYSWPVWTDDVGRHIAGDVTLHLARP